MMVSKVFYFRKGFYIIARCIHPPSTADRACLFFRLLVIIKNKILGTVLRILSYPRRAFVILLYVLFLWWNVLYAWRHPKCLTTNTYITNNNVPVTFTDNVENPYLSASVVCIHERVSRNEIRNTVVGGQWTHENKQPQITFQKITKRQTWPVALSLH